MRRFRVLLQLAVAGALVLGLSGRASATPLLPDLTISGLDITWNGSFFSATAGVGVLSLDTGASSLGSTTITWDGATGSISVSDLLGLLGAGNGEVLGGSISSFFANVFNPGPGATFVLTAQLITSLLGHGNFVTIDIGSSDFTSLRGEGSGTGNADVFPNAVPEPATLGLLSVGVGFLAARRRRGSAISS